ncbi:MAG TPA: competence/damage-inducible protein A [Bryobacteraceae bacterium]|nr:competence/damage-inducible protein A [Bryobacteraceae bacterium]
MNAEIIAVGSELLTPQRLDTNSLFLTEHLNGLGVEVTTKYVVGDNRDHVADAIRRAMSRAHIVILSGGLGPTEDDVTRDAVAQALDRKLIFHPEISDHLEQRFRQANRKMAEVNKRQALIIDGADILPNDRGTAPGQWIDEAETSIILLPGPPHELKAMFTRQCLARLERVVPKQVIRTLQLRVAGMAESDLDQTISPVYKKYENPVTTILAGEGDIQIHLRARCATEAEAMALLAEVAGPIELLLGDRIYSRNGDSLEATVGELLNKHHATLAVAESATGGLLAQRITSVPGSSNYFLGGFITYSNKMKTDLLGVSEETIAQHGAVSQETAEAMAIGARRRAGATFALSITGEAGPEPKENVPVGTMYVALADANGCQVVHRVFLGDRARIRVFSTQMALDLLRRRCTLVTPAQHGS